MKLLDILLENTLEYKVEFVTIKDKDVSQGSASYKDLADAKKFFDSLTKDPEVYRAGLEKVMGADSSRDMAGASFVGGTETIERYSHPATKGVSQGGKRSDELTPAELDIRDNEVINKATSKIEVVVTVTEIGRPQAGDIAFSSGESKFKGYTGSAWVDFH